MNTNKKLLENIIRRTVREEYNDRKFEIKRKQVADNISWLTRELERIDVSNRPPMSEVNILSELTTKMRSMLEDYLKS